MKRQSRVTRPPIATLAIALLLVGCVAAPGEEPSGSGATSEVAPSPTAAAPSSATRPSATVDDGAFWTTPAVPVGEIDSGEPVDRFGESRGAMSILLLGPFGDTASVASAVCSGIGELGWPGVRSDPLPLIGEAVTVNAHGPPEVERSGAASYWIVPGGLYRDPVLESGMWVSRSRGLGLRLDDEAPPDGIDETAFHRPFAGLDQAARMDAVVAWRCDPVDPSRTEPPQPTPRPTAICPARTNVAIADIIPKLTLGRGDNQTDGVAGSITFEQCGMSGGDDTPWITPENGVSLRGDAPLAIRLVTEGTLFDVGYAASYAAAEDPTFAFETSPLRIVGNIEQDSFLLEAPPPGDWSISVSVGVNDTVHGVVFTSPYYFRVRIQP